MSMRHYIKQWIAYRADKDGDKCKILEVNDPLKEEEKMRFQKSDEPSLINL